MIQAAPANPFESFLLRFAVLIGGLSRCVGDHHRRAEQPVYAAVLDLLDKIFTRVQRAVHAFEPGRPTRKPSAACLEAAAAARAARAASGTQAETASRVTRGRGFRLPQGFGWLPRVSPEAEAYVPQMRDILNEPALAELLANAPIVRRTLLSLCNMLGVGTFKVEPTQVAALGRYDVRRGWRVREKPSARDAGETARPGPSLDRPQNE